MKLKEVSKPKTELTMSDSPELRQGPWHITGWYGADGNYYERFIRASGKSIHNDDFKSTEKWYRLATEWE